MAPGQHKREWGRETGVGREGYCVYARERERETDRQTDRQTDTDTDTDRGICIEPETYRGGRGGMKG